MRKCAAGLLLGALLFTTTPSWAGDPNNEEALRRGYEADALFSQGQWDEAYEAFAAAEALAHSPVFVLYMAHCRRNAGRLLEAERLYQRVAGEKLSSEASPPFRDAIAEAEREVERIRGRIPTLRILAPASASIEIDGEPTAGPVVRLDPGPHRVVARSEAKQVERTVTLGEGSEVELPHPG